MTHHFRRLTLDDRHDYLALMLAAYAPIKALGIHFDAATADLARVTRHLTDHAVFALFDDQRMVASVTLRFPWGVQPGPFNLPHIGWFGTHPEFRGKNLGGKTAELAGTNCPAGGAKSARLFARHRGQPSVAARFLRPAGVHPDVYNRPRQRPHHAVYEKSAR